jgi:hypothetical protein
MYGLGVLLELLVSARINFLEIYRYKARASLLVCLSITTTSWFSLVGWSWSSLACLLLEGS